MKELGIGVRVWVGWTPDADIEASADPRMCIGTIVDGPFLKGEECYSVISGEDYTMWQTMWNVAIDGRGRVSCAEKLLTPIDDDFLLPRDEEQGMKA